MIIIEVPRTAVCMIAETLVWKSLPKIDIDDDEYDSGMNIKYHMSRNESNGSQDNPQQLE